MTSITFTKADDGRYEYSYTSSGKKRVFQLNRELDNACIVTVSTRLGDDMPWVAISNAKSLDGEKGMMIAVDVEEGIRAKISVSTEVTSAGYVEGE